MVFCSFRFAIDCRNSGITRSPNVFFHCFCISASPSVFVQPPCKCIAQVVCSHTSLEKRKPRPPPILSSGLLVVFLLFAIECRAYKRGKVFPNPPATFKKSQNSIQNFKANQLPVGGARINAWACLKIVQCPGDGLAGPDRLRPETCAESSSVHIRNPRC